MRSMTGFGSSVIEENELQIRCEISSVNHRYFEAKIILPEIFDSIKVHVLKYLRKLCIRGKHQLVIKITGRVDEQLDIDDNSMKMYIDLYNKLNKNLSFDKIDFCSFINLPGVLKPKKEDIDKFFILFKKLINNAVIELNKMKEREGSEIKQFILEQLSIIDAIVGRLNNISEKLKENKISKINNKIKKLDLNSLSQNCIEQEIVFLSDRYDIAEEIQRLEMHIKNFKIVLDEQIVGKKLGFILQEMSRETNTIGSKMPNETISFEVIELKNRLEKIREQVQNIE